METETRTDRLARPLVAAWVGSVGLVVVALGLSPAHAGAWPMPKGEGQVLSGLSVGSADEGLNDAGESSQSLTFLKRELSVYYEHGLTNELTFVFRPAYQQVELEDAAQSIRASGLGATEIGLRRALVQRPAGVLSAQISALAPGPGENALDTRFGEGPAGADVRLLAGRGWSGRAAGFAEVQLGARLFEAGKPTEARLDLTVGLKSTPLGEVFAQSYSVWSDGEPGSVRPYRHHRAQLTLVEPIRGGLSAYYGVSSVVAGRNVVADDTAFVGLWIRY